MKWKFWAGGREEGEPPKQAEVGQEGIELPPILGQQAPAIAKRYEDMTLAFTDRAAGKLREGDPKESLYRQLRVFSHLVYYPAFDAKYPSLEDWEKFASERPKGLNDDDRQKLDRLLNERLSHHKIEGYRRAAHELDIYLKTRPKKA